MVVLLGANVSNYLLVHTRPLTDINTSSVAKEIFKDSNMKHVRHRGKVRKLVEANTNVEVASFLYCPIALCVRLGNHRP
jgi:hypothetical protein